MLIGHKRIWNFLTQSAHNGRLAHAYLFVGPAQVGKRTLAMKFAKWLLCNNRTGQSPCESCRSCVDIEKNQHPDVFVLKPRQEEKKGVIKTLEIGIDEIKVLQHQLSLFSFSSNYKIAIIDGIDYLTREAANSFLKTLEEPTQNSIIILVSSDWFSVLPTIISRCQLIKFVPVPEYEIIAGLEILAKDKQDLKAISKLAAGRPGRAIELAGDRKVIEKQRANVEIFKKILKPDLVWRWELAKQLSQNTDEVQEFLSQWLLWLRDKLLQNQGLENLAADQKSLDKTILSKTSAVNLMREIQRTRTTLGNPSFNTRLAFETLMLKI